MAKAFHSLLRRGSVILHPAVPPAMAKVGGSAAVAVDFVRLRRTTDSVRLYCFTGAVTRKGKVIAPVASCFIVPRFSSFRDHIFPSRLSFEVPACASSRSDEARLSNR